LQRAAGKRSFAFAIAKVRQAVIFTPIGRRRKTERQDMAAAFDVVGIGNALVDVVSHIEDGFLQEQKLAKGTMTLVDSHTADFLYGKMPPGVEVSGGSCANTMAALASLGGKGAYIGKVRDDYFGQVFRHDMNAIGVQFSTPASPDGPPTGRCLVLVSPDAQRTMCTDLGAASALGVGDLNAGVIQSGRVTYMEGYLFDRPDAQRAFVRAAQYAHDSGHKVSVTLSDPVCVERHRDAFRELVADHIDILFANEEEIMSLYQATVFDEAIQKLHAQGHVDIACLTRSEKGSVIIHGDEVHVIDAEPIRAVVDTTGAGDAYAAGFLYGYTQGFDLGLCGRIAAIAAGEVISHNGARPEQNLAALVAQKLGSLPAKPKE
jgi:sugar/nucleoside kinase (ribokinase family)